jgi:hypothetical protein
VGLVVPRRVVPQRLSPSAVTPTLVGASGAAPAGTVEITFRSSDVFAEDTFHWRRGFLGGTLARAWASIEQDGTRYVVSFEQGGSSADPTDWEAALSGATHAFADLGMSNQSATEVAAAFVTAIEGLGVTGVSADAGVVTIEDASGLLIGADGSSDTSLRGMWGMQRDFGWYDGVTTNGSMGGTGSVHIPSPGTGRVLGLYIRAQSGGDVRLALSTGPAYSTNPTVCTVLGQGVVEDVADNDMAVVLFDAPVAIDAGDSLWFHFRGLAATQLRFREHGGTPTANGDLVDGEQLLWDTATVADGDPTVVFGATYDPDPTGGGGPFALYASVGILYELEDGDGRYPCSGNIDTWAGYLGPALTNASLTIPSDMYDETVHFRAHTPAWTTVDLTEIRQAVGTRTAGDDFGIGLYVWQVADIPEFPSLDPASLLVSIGPFGVTTASANNTHVLASPRDIGTTVLGGAAISVAVNCGRAGGTQATTLQFVYDEDVVNEPSLDHWTDDGRAWSDWIDEGSYGDPRGGGLQDTEYQTRTSNGSTMPAGDPTATWPDPFEVDSSGTPDAAPRNVPRMALHLVRVVITGS